MSGTVQLRKLIPNVVMWRVEEVTHLDAVVMEVRVRQELIGGVVHVRGQELTHKVTVHVRLGRHVVGEAKQVIHAHVGANFHCVNEVRSDFCDVQVVEEIASKVGEAKLPSSFLSHFFADRTSCSEKKVNRENANKKQSFC